MVGCGSGKKGLTTKTTVYDIDRLNLKSAFNNDDLCKKAYGIKDNQKINCGTETKHNVTLIGDSHARDCASILQQKLKDRCMVIGYVKPGARLENLINTVKHETNKLTKDDHLIFWGGANNISRTSTSKSLIQIFRYILARKTAH